VRTAKWVFFNSKIQEITLTNKKIWNLISWIKKQKRPVIEAIKFNRFPYDNFIIVWLLYYTLPSKFNNEKKIKIKRRGKIKLPTLLSTTLILSFLKVSLLEKLSPPSLSSTLSNSSPTSSNILLQTSHCPIWTKSLLYTYLAI